MLSSGTYLGLQLPPPSYARWGQGRNPLLCQGRNNRLQVPEFREEERGMGWDESSTSREQNWRGRNETGTGSLGRNMAGVGRAPVGLGSPPPLQPGRPSYLLVGTYSQHQARQPAMKSAWLHEASSLSPHSPQVRPSLLAWRADSDTLMFLLVPCCKSGCCHTRGFFLPGHCSGPGDTCHSPQGLTLTQPPPPKPNPLREEARQPDNAQDRLNMAWLWKGHTYSESGDSSEMLWEVAERGVEGHIAEGVEEVCTAERVAVVWGPEGVLEDCTEDRTEELKEARMEERISNCSVEGCRLGMASRFSLEGCLLDSGSRLSLDSCLLERLPRLSCEGCLLGTVSRGSLELDLLERKSSCSLEFCLADASWSLEGCLLESKSNCSREVSRLGNVSIRSLDTCLLGNVFSHPLETSLTGPQSSCSLDPNLQGKVSRWSLEPCLRGSVFP